MAHKNLLKGFKRPGGITFEHTDSTSNYGKCAAHPFEPGFGTTVGNTLRRVLLSSIPGYAVTAVRITSYDADGVAHVTSSEFDAIPNIVEDTLEVLSVVKKLRFKLPDDQDSASFQFEFKGPGTVTSDDFAKTGLEVLSKAVPVFTMMDDAKVDFELQVDLGRGYVPSEDNGNFIEIVGTIPMDSIFTPVQKVSYNIEPCRVGQRNDFDKLILEIWTDGTISPADALADAAKIAKEHFSVFMNFNDANYVLGDDFEEEDERIRQILNTSVEDLELSVRSSNCLRNANIRTIGELTKYTEESIQQTRNFGKKSLEEITEKLGEWNLAFGMTDYSHLKNTALYRNENREDKESDDES
ncbi:MAG: DNA-directed RNA polymerase subunit alpha [Treponemataceae bacterium]|nr:MAG: DNA-directed RNA polymerase subunit alpha [Treponemataceae bacterium]